MMSVLLTHNSTPVIRNTAGKWSKNMMKTMRVIIRHLLIVRPTPEFNGRTKDGFRSPVPTM
jgi:hypothetical protein